MTVFVFLSYMALPFTMWVRGFDYMTGDEVFAAHGDDLLGARYRYLVHRYKVINFLISGDHEITLHVGRIEVEN